MDELSALKAELEASLQALESEYNALDSSDSAQGQKLRGEINQTQAKINAVDKAFVIIPIIICSLIMSSPC